jgi:hypothetical protein
MCARVLGVRGVAGMHVARAPDTPTHKKCKLANIADSRFPWEPQTVTYERLGQSVSVMHRGEENTCSLDERGKGIRTEALSSIPST